MSARFTPALQGAFGHVRKCLERTEAFTKTERTSLAYGLLDDLLAMPLADRVALARALVPECAVVPREATPKMVEAAWRFANRDLEDGKWGQMEALLQAAIAAAAEDPHDGP